MAGFALFGLGSAVSGAAYAAQMVIGGQVVAGIGGALVTPASLAILLATFTGPHAKGKALGTWASTAGAGVVVGPLVGGLLTSVVSWRAVFYFNVPITVIGIVLTVVAVRQFKSASRRHFDPCGQLLGIISLASLTYGIIEAGNGSSAVVVGALIVGFSLVTC